MEFIPYLISNVGFPIVACICMWNFITKNYNKK